jgi:pSer/pThr/pTyr-binding forkhead associated (FHA) protein
MKLELINVDRQKPPIVLHEFPVIVGLDRGADICLDDSAVGHYHCMIDIGDDGLMVWDLGTRSGTFINGVRVCQKAPLQSGDELGFGKTRFLARYDDGKSKSSRTVEQPRRREPALPV